MGSFILGMIVALSELGPRWLWHGTRRMAAAIQRAAGNSDRFTEGYDLIADRIG